MPKDPSYYDRPVTVDQHDRHASFWQTCPQCRADAAAVGVTWRNGQQVDVRDLPRAAPAPAPRRAAPTLADKQTLMRLRRLALERRANLSAEVVRTLDPASHAVYAASVVPNVEAGRGVQSRPVGIPRDATGNPILLDERVTRALDAQAKLAELDGKREARARERSDDFLVDDHGRGTAMSASVEQVEKALVNLGIRHPTGIQPTQHELDQRKAQEAGREKEAKRLGKLAPQDRNFSPAERLVKASLVRKLHAAKEGGRELHASELTPSELQLHLRRLGIAPGGGAPYTP